MQEITIYTKQNNEPITLKQLKVQDIDKIMQLQYEIIEGLEDQTFLAETSLEEIERCIEGQGELWGYMTKEGMLVAVGMYMCNKEDTHNYGYDIDLSGEALLRVGQVEMMLVKAGYRGNRLQKRLCKKLEEVARRWQTPIMMATVAPENKYSLDTFLREGYGIVKEKIKYDDLRRYILKKELEDLQ